MINSTILSEWSQELADSLDEDCESCIALFSTDRKLIFVNEAMDKLFKGEPHESLINPTFDRILEFDNKTSNIFEGYLTIGDYSSINTSIYCKIFKKDKKILIVGDVNTEQLADQNTIMHQLNRQLGNLQRSLLKEKRMLNDALIQLNKANKELEKLNKNKDIFISILAHDLKDPFSSILGFLRLLKKNMHNYDLDKIESNLTFIDKAAQNTFNLLEELLLWVQTESGNIKFNPKKNNLFNISNKAASNLEIISNTKEIVIENLIKKNITIFADYDMLNLIFRNLLSNSIKFTNRGGQISVDAIEINSEIAISISDNGIGMDTKVLNKLFDITQKITLPGTENEKGTGLGLFLCKDFVEKHGGRVWVESEVGKGSKFIFTIPI